MQPFLAILAVATASGLTLDVRTPKADVLPGEPIKLVLTWQAPVEADVILDNDNRGLRYLRVWVDDGGGFHRFCEAPRGSVEGIEVIRLPMTPRPYVQNVALVHGEYAEDCSGPAGKTFAFPSPGRYRLKLTYQRPGDSAITASNVVTFRVVPATGDDERLLATIRQSPWLLLTGGAHGELLSQFPDSPYMTYAKGQAFLEWESALRGRQDPDTGQSLWHLPQGEYERFARDQLRRKAQELMAERPWGAFDEERLGYAFSAAERSGDTEAAAGIRGEVVTRFENSQLAQRLRVDGRRP